MTALTLDRRAIMVRAWAIIAEQYDYPRVPFRSIGRACFGWALAEAWREHRNAESLAEIPTDTLLATIAMAKGEIDRAKYLPFGIDAGKVEDRARATVNRCRSELDRRAAQRRDLPRAA